MDNKLSIRVNVADRYYPLKVERENEERIRKAARMINEKVLQYKQRYTDKDVQDFLAMAALQYVIKLTEEEEKLEDDYLPDAIKELIQKIETDRDFAPKESPLCDWCDYQGLCPKRKHLIRVGNLPLNEYLNEEGVTLVNHYVELKEKKRISSLKILFFSFNST